MTVKHCNMFRFKLHVMPIGIYYDRLHFSVIQHFKKSMLPGDDKKYDIGLDPLSPPPLRQVSFFEKH